MNKILCKILLGLFILSPAAFAQKESDIPQKYRDYLKTSKDSNATRWLKLQIKEDSIINTVNSKTFEKNLFCIENILPLNDGSLDDITGSITCEGIEGNDEVVTFRTLFPTDQIKTVFTANGFKTIYPLGKNSVWRFIKKVDLVFDKEENAPIFYGNEDDPLAFMLIDKKGFVYLHGKGSVTLPSGKTFNFPGATGIVSSNAQR
jgi:hypothetical protein